jgi:hypothetical protein
MWIMLITFIFSAQGNFNASVSTAEFASKESCETARIAYLKQFGDIDKLNDEARKRWERGLEAGPSVITATALCVQK